MTEVIEAEYAEVLPAVIEAAPPARLFTGDSPAEIVARATETANALAKVVKDKKLTTAIQGREHARVEAWTLLGTLLGVFPYLVWSRPTGDGNGWEARVEARTLAGLVVGASEAQCTRSESTWARRDDYALRSMAQTRATSKALRQPLGFVMTLAGFDPTPYEEMPRIPDAPAAPKPRARAKKEETPPAEQSAFVAPEGATSGLIDADQQHSLVELVRDKGIPLERVKQIIKNVGGVDTSAELTVEKFADVMAMIETEDLPFS